MTHNLNGNTFFDLLLSQRQKQLSLLINGSLETFNLYYENSRLIQVAKLSQSKCLFKKFQSFGTPTPHLSFHKPYLSLCCIYQT